MGRRKNIFSLFKIGNRRKKSLLHKKRRTSIFGRSRRSNPFNSLIRFIEAIAKLCNVFLKLKK